MNAFFSISTSPFTDEKSAFLTLFYTNWEEIESLKTKKSPGIVLEKSWNSVFPFLYEPCGKIRAKNMKLGNKGHFWIWNDSHIRH